MARVLEKNYFLSNTPFQKTFSLYNCEKDAVAERYSSLTEGLSGAIRFFSSPGRTELVGNHTDHNNGFVLAAAIDMDTVAAVMPINEQKIVVNSVGYPPVEVNLTDLFVDPSQYGTSDALVKGVAKAFLDRGYKIGGFIANTHSTVFKGAGVSSSASFELLISEILNSLYNGKRINETEKAIISQYAENVYFGKPSGLMDQLTISLGGVSFMDFEDPKAPKASSLKWTFDDLSIVMANCGGDHCNLTHEYAEIREDMHKAAGYFGQEVLRKVDKNEFVSSYKALLDTVGGRAVLRAKHYLEENGRVLTAVKALKDKDENTFLDMIRESGISSRIQLQNCFAKLDPDQRLLFGLKIAEEHPLVLASRVHGGGFAGTMLSFTKKENAQAFVNDMQGIFGKENVFLLKVRNCGTTETEV